MKKIILIIFASLMFANIGFAEMRVIEEVKIRAEINNYIFATFCIDGYKFLLNTGEQGKAMTQFFERAGGVSLPTRC